MWSVNTAIAGRLFPGQLCRCLAAALILFATYLNAAELDVSFERWRGHKYETALPDGSTLVEFAGETNALSAPGHLLRVGFIPRFACTPLITVQASRSYSLPQGSGWRFTPNELRIDGTTVSIPMIADVNGDNARFFIDATSVELEALRRQIDLANLATLRIEEDERLVFSLFGSERTLAAVEALCRQYEATADD